MPEVGVPKMLMGGAWVEASDGRRYQTFNPSDGSVIAQIPLGGTADVDRAVASAERAAPEWGRMDPRSRGRILLQLVARVREAAERLAALDALNAGLTLRIARRDVALGADRLEYFAELAQETKGETFPSSRSSFVYSVRQPFGVVAVINPYNHPVMFALSKAAAPLAAGNTLVVKPPDQAPLSTIELGRIASEVLPPGVFNVLTGQGAAGAALVSHSAVRMVTFTGSVATGASILSAVAPRILPAILELGGKNAVIVLEDADLDAAVNGALLGMNLGVSGQSCQSGTRLFLHSAIRDEFMSRFLKRLAAVKVGPALDEASEMGPLISARQREKVMGYVDLGQREGAKLVAGGTVPNDPSLRSGWFVSPTVFDGVDMSMRIAQEEIFGPVLSVLTWSDEAQMVSQVNSLEMGLTASVWTRSLRAHALVRDIEAGYTYINQHGGAALGVPFGGWKQSGMGVEHSLEELLAFTRIKVVDSRVS